MSGCIALVVAAGRGTRAGGAMPKQYRPLAGRPVLRHSLEIFRRQEGINGVRSVIHPDDRAYYEAASAGLDLLPPVTGGATRQDSVRLGLESLTSIAPEFVLIHDAARPLIDPATIERTIAALVRHPGAVPAVPVADTLKRGDAGLIAATIERTGLWRAQTPQGFRFHDILAAHRAAAGLDLGDDAMVAERAGLRVALVEGSESNLKLTTEADFTRAAALAAGSLGDVRVGQGFDVHRFGAGDHVMLCGVRIAHSLGLVGHSDADVALHALTDAILGALALGDIGQHFPPGDPKWRAADSAMFLRHAGSLVTSQGGIVAHADLTIICEQPKVGPHRDAMRARLGEILAVDPARCSVKATTTEGLGFAGRGEGIAAHAVVTLRLPFA